MFSDSRCKDASDLFPFFHSSATKLFACWIVTELWSFTRKSDLVIRALNRARFCVVCALNCARILVVRSPHSAPFPTQREHRDDDGAAGGRRHSTCHGDVAVVPRVVVDKRRAVRHASDLVAVVPPRHDARPVRRVLSQPVVRLAEVVENVARADNKRDHDGRQRRPRRTSTTTTTDVTDDHDDHDGRHHTRFV